MVWQKKLKALSIKSCCKYVYLVIFKHYIEFTVFLIQVVCVSDIALLFSNLFYFVDCDQCFVEQTF